MARPALKDGLGHFRTWMKETDRCSPATAKAYTSCVRRVLREVGEEPDQDAIDTFFFSAWTEGSSYNNLKSAWKVYVEWQEETEGLAVPLPGQVTKQSAPTQRERADALVPLPENVRVALRALEESGMSGRDIHRMTWKNVDMEGLLGSEPVRVRVPGEVNTFWRVPVRPLLILWEHSDIGSDWWKPLVPREPGSDQFYPYRRLLREMNDVSQVEQEEQAEVLKQKLTQRVAELGPEEAEAPTPEPMGKKKSGTGLGFNPDEDGDETAGLRLLDDVTESGPKGPMGATEPLGWWDDLTATDPNDSED